MKFFELGGVQIPLEASIDFRQTYGEVQKKIIHRMRSGAAAPQSTFSKIKTTLTGSGYSVHGLDGLDYDDPAGLELKCAEPRAVGGTSNIIIVPSARRSDSGYEPFGIAIVRNRRVFVGVASVSGDQYTLETNPEATAYQVVYYPKITVIAHRPESLGGLRWKIEAEEV